MDQEPLIQQQESVPDIQTLDFDESRRGTIPLNHRFSSTKVKADLQQRSALEWAKHLDLSNTDYYTYPSDLDKAELHRQSHYLLPDEAFLNKCTAEGCDCGCGKKLRRKRVNWLFQDMYEYVSDEFGITLPLYFTFVKIHIFILILAFLVYGIFFIMKVKQFCSADAYHNLQCNNHQLGDFCWACEFSGFYSFINIETMLEELKQDEYSDYKLFQGMAFVVFLINMFLPFVYETVIRYKQVQCWDKEGVNHLHENKKSIYVKHLPYKMTQKEIQITLQKTLSLDLNRVIAKKSHLFDQEQSIQELVYIYDVHELNIMNQEREAIFLALLITLEQIKELNAGGPIRTFSLNQIKTYHTFTVELLEDVFKQKMKDMLFITNKIKMYLKNGLPFTNKILVKFETQEQRQAVYLHYKKTWYQNLLIRYEILKEQSRIMKARKLVQDASIVESHPSESVDNLEDSCLKDANLPPTILSQQQQDYSDKYIEQVHHQLRVHRGFRANEVNWENIGMNTLTRFKIRMYTLLRIIIVCAIMMSGFEFIYLYQNNPNMKKNIMDDRLSTGQKVITNILSILITVLSTYATLTLLGGMANSRRTTYTDLEMNILNFILFLQMILITFFPYIMTYGFWDGKSGVLPIYDLVSLSMSRIWFKAAFHTFHLRHSKFWLRKRKALKAFNPKLYFQGQLNEIMTPPQFPQRGRMLCIFFFSTVALTMIYVCPLLVVLCIGLETYLLIFDKYACTHNYQIDTKFNLEHMSYFVKTYQIIVMPMNIYLYMTLFWGTGMCIYVGVPVSIIIVLMMLLFKRAIVNLIVFKLLRQRKKRPTKVFKEKPFFESYEDHFRGLRVEALTELLANIFKGNMQSNRQSEEVQVIK